MLVSGDKNVMEHLYDMYSGALYGICLKIVKDSEIAQDVLQDSFIKIWKNGGKYEPSKGRLFTWMLNIARNTAIDHLRSKAMKYEIQNIDNNVSVIERENAQTLNVDTIGLKQHLDRLRKEDREVIDLAYFGGFTQEEVAEKLSIPLGTVKTRARRALTDLRKLFNEFRGS